MTHTLLVAAHRFHDHSPDYANTKIEDEYYSRNQNAFVNLHVLNRAFVYIREIVSTFRTDFTIVRKTQSR